MELNFNVINNNISIVTPTSLYTNLTGFIQLNFDFDTVSPEKRYAFLKNGDLDRKLMLIDNACILPEEFIRAGVLEIKVLTGTEPTENSVELTVLDGDKPELKYKQPVKSFAGENNVEELEYTDHLRAKVSGEWIDIGGSGSCSCTAITLEELEEMLI